MSISRVAVVGAGLIGVAIAREVTRRLPDAEVTVFDRADHIAAGQSGHTAGIVQPGLTEEPGSLEAGVARRGVELLVRYTAEQGLPYRECGQLIVAQNTDEVERLEELATRAEKNGVPGVRMLDRAGMTEVEPQVRGVQALYSPHTAITDFSVLAEALAADVRKAGGRFRFRTEVTGIDAMSNKVRLRARDVPVRDGETTTPSESGYSTEIATADVEEESHERPQTYRGDDGDADPNGKGSLRHRLGDELRTRFGDKDWFRQAEGKIDEWTGVSPADRSRPHPPAEVEAGVFDLVFLAAGLQGDRLAVAAGLDADPRIVPFTSTYSKVGDPAAEAVAGIISSVPDPAAPVEETVLARSVDGALLLGPTTHLSLGRDGETGRDINLGDLGASFGFSGFWKFASQTAKTAAQGVRTAASTAAFVETLTHFVPDLDTGEMETGPRGVRAQAINAAGEPVDALTVTARGRLTALRSTPRWAAGMALGIAERVAERGITSAQR